MAHPENLRMERLDTGKKNNIASDADNTVEIVYYTDPLCCWSLVFEQKWQRLQNEYKGKLSWRYCMGGLLPNWKNYVDSLNSVTRPIQMGPVWMHAAQVGGVSIHHRLWMEDPPTSSYPACIAVKCAELQSSEAGEIYLRLIREACMKEGKNISKNEVLQDVASTAMHNYPEVFSLAVFNEDFKSGRGLDAFRKDLQETQYHRINRFPTLIIKRLERPAIRLTGNIPYNALQQMMDGEWPAKSNI